LELPEMTNAQAKEWLDHLSALADVTVQAFMEQREQARAAYAVAEPLAVETYLLRPTALAA
jgi:hypothetical protein